MHEKRIPSLCAQESGTIYKMHCKPQIYATDIDYFILKFRSKCAHSLHIDCKFYFFWHRIDLFYKFKKHKFNRCRPYWCNLPVFHAISWTHQNDLQTLCCALNNSFGSFLFFSTCTQYDLLYTQCSDPQRFWVWFMCRIVHCELTSAKTVCVEKLPARGN